MLINQRRIMSSRTWIPLCIFLLIVVGMDDAQLTANKETNAGNALSNAQFKNALQRALNDLQKLRPEAYHYSGAKKGFLSAYNFPQYPYKVEKSSGSNFLDLARSEGRIVRNAVKSKREVDRVSDGAEPHKIDYLDWKESCRALPTKIETSPLPKSNQTNRRSNKSDAPPKPENSSLSSILADFESSGERAKRDTTVNDDHSRPEVIRLPKRQHNRSVERKNVNGISSGHQVKRSLNAQPHLEAGGRPGRSVKDSRLTDGSSQKETVGLPAEEIPPKAHERKREISNAPSDPRPLKIANKFMGGEEYHDAIGPLASTEPRSFDQDEEGGNVADKGGPGAEGRRFLFSPSISNTITNLNQNTNTNTNVIHHTPGTIDDGHPARPEWIPKKPMHQPVVPYPFYGPNPFGEQRKSSKTIDKEFDLRGAGLKKICFLL